MGKVVLGLTAVLITGLAGIYGFLDTSFQPNSLQDQQYRVSVQEAASIYQKETKEKQFDHLEFAIPKEKKGQSAGAYGYVFTKGEHAIVVDPMTGEVTHTKKQAEDSAVRLEINDLDFVKTPQVAMAEAVRHGTRHVRVSSWSLTHKQHQLYYQIHLEDKEDQSDVLVAAKS